MQLYSTLWDVLGTFDFNVAVVRPKAPRADALREQQGDR
jgi:hypothetical protein